MLRLLELENRGTNFQLIFQKEATSYSVALIIVLLSREFTLDKQLKKEYPHLKDEIFEVLTNLNYIAGILQQDINLRIHHLYSRQEEMLLNEGLAFNDLVLEQIKWSPSFPSLEYMMSSNDFRHNLKKDLFDKVTLREDYGPTDSLKMKSHFIEVYWQHLSTRKISVGTQDAWKYTDNFLRLMDLSALRDD